MACLLVGKGDSWVGNVLAYHCWFFFARVSWAALAGAGIVRDRGTRCAARKQRGGGSRLAVDTAAVGVRALVLRSVRMHFRDVFCLRGCRIFYGCISDHCGTALLCVPGQKPYI